ncbi:unnamed protein product [Linum tenue]|uniref:Fibronectin type-III domain-containing protein n=1 Tax=Linum tenue TaxID=586396 RepID=A0AAV0PVD1_9ROSI|nr:unnamed protein product [Linum tenue]
MAGRELDSSDCGKLSMEEKRELVYQLWDQPDAAELLQAWSRHDILQILCSEMGKERKYTGLTKLKIIEQLLKIVSDKKSSFSAGYDKPGSSSPAEQKSSNKRQRKMDVPPSRLLPVTPTSGGGDAPNQANTVYCKNSACKATMKQGDTFCKRCSCCICHKYDDNKDPSLWMICSTDPPFQGPACGMSCHLDCALKHESAGIGGKDEEGGGRRGKLDGSFRCAGCGKINDLLVFLRKQLIVAKETRRVDILCYRLSVSQKLLNGTVKYQELLEIVDEAIKQLESEVGPITGLPVKMGRGIVNRLSVGSSVQKQCASVLELLDNFLTSFVSPPLQDPAAQAAAAGSSSMSSPITVQFEDATSTSITLVLSSEYSPTEPIVGYTLWHRKALAANYPAEPTCRLSVPNTTYILADLDPATEYWFKVTSFNNREEHLGTSEVHFSTCGAEDEEAEEISPSGGERSQSPVVTNCSSLSDPSSDLGKLDADHSTEECQIDDTAVATDTDVASLPITPCKLEMAKDIAGRKNPRSKDAADESQDGTHFPFQLDERSNGNPEKEFEFCVKVIRWLECEGHIEKNFRQKFLTWYSLRASAEEMRVVKAFVDTLIEDPSALAEQLVDTFSECVSSKRLSVVPAGFCMKLWH